MSFENPHNPERIERKKGLALKVFISGLIGVLERNKDVSAAKGRTLASIEKGTELFDVISEVEGRIDPEGQLMAEMEDRVVRGLKCLDEGLGAMLTEGYDPDSGESPMSQLADRINASRARFREKHSKK